MGSLTIACLSTFAALGLLALTEAYDPPGSSLGWLITIGLIAGHLPLLSRNPDDPRYRPFAPFGTRVALVAAPLLLILAMAWPLWNAHEGIFTTAVLPRKSAQLGLMTQVVSRLGGEELLYGYTYPRDGYTQVNPFPAGGVIPYALARQAGLDWRYANLAAGALLLALLIPGMIALARRGTAGSDNERALAVLAMALAGGGWMAFGRSTDYLNWGTTPVLWPLILCLGYCLAARLSLLAALCAGLLAAMNPGWLLLLPVVGSCLYKDNPRDFPKCLALAVIAPFLAWTAFPGQFQVMLEGILGGPFSEGVRQSRGASWRFPSIHGLADWLSARHLVYLLALGAIGFLAREIARREDRGERLRLLALAGFLLVACAPATYFFHWMAHGILLAGLLPAIAACPSSGPAADPLPQFAFRLVDWIPGAAVTALLIAAILLRLHGGVDGTIDRLPGRQQGVDRNLLSGFNVRSEDHAWGKDPNMAVGFTMTERMPGTLELHLGTIGGDFTPFNPTTIRVNGQPRGLFHAIPGDYRYARVPVAKDDLLVGFNVVELDAAWSRTPRSLNVANDDRHVSINYLGMRFLPAAEGAKPR